MSINTLLSTVVSNSKQKKSAEQVFCVQRAGEDKPPVRKCAYQSGEGKLEGENNQISMTELAIKSDLQQAIFVGNSEEQWDKFKGLLNGLVLL